jgi:dephospho-CoA kinase
MKIGIFGPLCSGKSTLANYIIYYTETFLCKKFTKITFASAIYDIAYNLFDMKVKDRKLLQDIGRKLRDIDENVFTKNTMKKCNNVYNNHIIIDDGRLLSEFNAMVENDFKLIYLNISTEKQIERIKQTYPDNYQQHIDNLQHSTEQELLHLPMDKFDLIIDVDKLGNGEDYLYNIVQQFIYRYAM